VGDLFVANGGQLTSGEARLGGLLPATGTAVVGGDGSLWETGNIAVGYGVSGTLTIENGGRVNSNDAYVSYGVLSDDSQVTVEGIGLGNNQASMWALLGNLFIGQSMFGSVEVLNGGDLYVSQDVYIKTALS
jgi:T5SS/PEP-CTERM-associated repeat protein